MLIGGRKAEFSSIFEGEVFGLSRAVSAKPEGGKRSHKSELETFKLPDETRVSTLSVRCRHEVMIHSYSRDLPSRIYSNSPFPVYV